MRGPKLLLVGSILVLALGACSNDEAGDGDAAGGGTSPTASASATAEPSETPGDEPSETPEPTETPGSGRETEVETEDSSLGTILTDSDGNTLYVFLADTDGASTCYDDCADNWPAFLARGEVVAGDGVDAALLGTTERTDGAMQVTYAGQPLYFFAGDEQPGDTNGQAVGDVWFVIAPNGEPVEG
jgi:predicted lipoprotein with Yx(FWY)xxD motif